MEKSKTTPKVGQIWQEVDPRFKRFVKIMGIDREIVRIRSVYKTQGGDWQWAHHETKTKLSRFNGKRSGFSYVEG